MCSRSASGTDAGERNTCKGGADTESRDLTREVLRSTGEAGIGYSSPWGARTWLEKAPGNSFSFLSFIFIYFFKFFCCCGSVLFHFYFYCSLVLYVFNFSNFILFFVLWYCSALFLFIACFFWLCHMTCRVLVPRPGLGSETLWWGH